MEVKYSTNILKCNNRLRLLLFAFAMLQNKHTILQRPFLGAFHLIGPDVPTCTLIFFLAAQTKGSIYTLMILCLVKKFPHKHTDPCWRVVLLAHRARHLFCMTPLSQRFYLAAWGAKLDLFYLLGK